MSGVKNLPDAYKKRVGTNNEKLLRLIQEPIAVYFTDPDTGEEVLESGVLKDLEDVYETLDINKAKGKVLDEYGVMLGQPRGKATDAQYLLMLKGKIAKNISDGSYDSVLEAIKLTFMCEYSDVVIEPTGNPCEMIVTKLPVSVLVNAGLTTKQSIAIIAPMMPAGVKLLVDEDAFEGSFCFTGLESEYDENAGFANDEQTIGGFFGIMLGEDEEVVLPV